MKMARFFDADTQSYKHGVYAGRLRDMCWSNIVVRENDRKVNYFVPWANIDHLVELDDSR
jgi:hypothetical protein